MSRVLKISVLLLLVAGMATACGRRGQLEPPPSAKGEQAIKDQQAKDQQAREGQSGGTKVNTGRKQPPITAPKRDLFIDPLLD